MNWDSVVTFLEILVMCPNGFVGGDLILLLYLVEILYKILYWVISLL